MSNTIYTYNCMGCGKKFNSHTEYPHGWICLKCRPTIKVNLKCSDCGDTVSVFWNTYRMKDPNIPWRCRSCNDKYRNQLYDSKSPEEKAAFIAKQKERSSEYWKNLSLIDKEKDSNRRKKLWEKRRVSGEDKRLLDAMKNGRAKWWNSLSDDDKKRQWDYMNDGRSKWWATLSDEEKMNHMIFPHEGCKKWWNSMSSKERQKYINKLRDANQKFWDEMTPDKYYKWRQHFNEGYIKYINTIDPYNTSVVPNKNESAIMNEFNMNNLKFTFQYPNTIIHPEFSKLFPFNYVTGATLIDPTHMWDFRVHTLDGDVFIDIDGSMHFKDTYTKTHPYSGITYKELDAKKFYDSQRPYQTDGLEAYAVLCYDDNLTNDTPVLNINTGEMITFKSLMHILIWMDMTDDEQQKIIKKLS